MFVHRWHRASLRGPALPALIPSLVKPEDLSANAIARTRFNLSGRAVIGPWWSSGVGIGAPLLRVEWHFVHRGDHHFAYTHTGRNLCRPDLASRGLCLCMKEGFLSSASGRHGGADRLHFR